MGEQSKPLAEPNEAADGAFIELAAESPDLRLVVMGESHAVGHQQWHLHDETHPRFDERCRAATGGETSESVCPVSPVTIRITVSK